MTSSNELSTINPWLYQQGFNVDSWLLPDTFSHDNDLLAKALHTTVTSSPHHTSLFDSSLPSSTTVSTGSDPEIITQKRKRNCLLTVSDKKRKSRASKRSLTTFITADPENFRAMVQQVTGANNYNNDYNSGLVLDKPEVNRVVVNNRVSHNTVVPMLDTSAFLCNHQQENNNGYYNNGGVGLLLPTVKTGVTVEDSYPVFPTLESWTVM